MLQPCRPMGVAVSAVIIIAAVLVAGCASLGERAAPAGIPPPPLQLLSAGNLELPRNCAVPDGVVYRTNFVVQGDGRVADIQPEAAPACLQAALAAWLHGAQYAPPGAAIATTMDWMAVSARRSN